ncbi:MAG: hypothetical protein AB1668_03770, partial [Nanoarchaeota archaeon]
RGMIIMYKKNKKKGLELTTTVIISLILAIVVLFVLFGGVGYVKKGLGSLGISFEETTQDCDRDRIEGQNDACPCTFGTVSQEYSGCPEGKKTAEFSKEDITTCSQYVSVKNPGTFVSECDAEDKDDCKTKCEAMHEGIQIVPEEKGKEGRKGDWDFYIESFEVTSLDNDEAVKTSSKEMAQLRVDLNGKEVAGFTFMYRLANKKEEDFIEKIRVVVEVCPDRSGKNCQEIEESVATYSSYEIARTGKGEIPETFGEVENFVGVNGDSCDGQGTKSCYLRLVIDKNKDGSGSLAETSETNNDAWVYLILENQKIGLFEFTKKKAIELVINDEGSADPEDKIIYQVCGGYIGEVGSNDGFACKSVRIFWGKVPCGSGEFPSDKGTGFSAPFENKGCLVVVDEEDYYTYDCGFAGAADGVIIDVNVFRKIEPLKTAFVNSDGNDADNALAYSWKALPNEGSLICSDDFWDDFWLVCDTAGDNQMLRTGGTDYLCRNKAWSKRS